MPMPLTHVRPTLPRFHYDLSVGFPKLQWADRSRVCWTATVDAEAPCLPFESMLNYLYPTIEGNVHGNSSLRFDGLMKTDIGTASARNLVLPKCLHG